MIEYDGKAHGKKIVDEMDIHGQRPMPIGAASGFKGADGGCKGWVPGLAKRILPVRKKREEPRRAQGHSH